MPKAVMPAEPVRPKNQRAGDGLGDGVMPTFAPDVLSNLLHDRVVPRRAATFRTQFTGTEIKRVLCLSIQQWPRPLFNDDGEIVEERRESIA